MKKGFSVIEILVVIGIFAMLSVVATQSIALTLRSSKKTDSIVSVKQELDYPAENIVRVLQMAGDIYGCGADDVAVATLGFKDIRGNQGEVGCLQAPPLNEDGTADPRIASSSGTSTNWQRMTSPNIQISDCTFTCYSQGSQTYIVFNATANAKGVTSDENSSYTVSKKILVRSAIKR